MDLYPAMDAASWNRGLAHTACGVRVCALPLKARVHACGNDTNPRTSSSSIHAYCA